MTNQKAMDICCPEFDKDKWEGKKFIWNNKKFIKDRVLTLFYMPVNFGAMMTKSMRNIEEVGGKLVEGMVLSEHTSMWGMNVYLAVDKEIPGVENTTLSGQYVSKVYEGSYSETGNWRTEFADYAKDKVGEVKKTLMWYTTCPKCAKKYGKNYVAIIGQISQDHGYY